MGIFLHGIGTGQVGGADAADELDLGCKSTGIVFKGKGMGLDILVQDVVGIGAVGRDRIRYVIHGSSAGNIAFGCGKEAEAVAVNRIESAVRHFGYGDCFASVDDHDRTVADIIGTYHEGTGSHAVVNAEIEAVSGGEVLVRIFFYGVVAGQSLVGGACSAYEFDLGGEVAVRILDCKCVGFHILIQHVIGICTVGCNGIGVVESRHKHGVLLERKPAVPENLVGSTVFEEDNGRQRICVFATLVSGGFLHQVNGDGALFHGLAVYGSPAQDEVAFFGHCIDRFGILVGGEIVLVAHQGGSEGSPCIIYLQVEDTASCLIRVGIHLCGGGRKGHFGRSREQAG